LGYQIIAISPDAPASLKVTNDEKLNLLLSDSTGELSKSVGIAFQAPENYKATIAKGSDGVNNSFARTGSVSFKCKY
jgi:peroxiredoxin